ncbi:MAG: hypothetical protein WCO93_12155 [bacterium]
MDAAGSAVRNACTPRWKSRLSYTFCTVSSSGKPSKNFRVPSRVSTASGVVMDAGMSVDILGLACGASCSKNVLSFFMLDLLC